MLLRCLVAIGYLPALSAGLAGLRAIAPGVHPSTYVYLLVIVAVSVGVGAAIDRWQALIAPLAVAALLMVAALTVADDHTAASPGSDTTQFAQYFLIAIIVVGATSCVAIGVTVRRLARQFTSRPSRVGVAAKPRAPLR